MNIIRGDTKHLKFKRVDKNTKEIIKEVPEKMYFTVKYGYNMDDFLIQKTLKNGITYNEDDGYFYMTIESYETDNLPYTENGNQLVFDIEIINNGDKTTIARGNINIEHEVTFASNEV